MPPLEAERHAFSDYDALLESYYERGWTDGMPVVPPTPEKVEEFLGIAGLAPNDVLGRVPTREVTCTAEQAAINAVMAGCRPDYFPAVVAAVRAHLEEKGNCHSTTGTLSGASQCLIINGPIREEIGVASQAGCFGPGFRANATIGRALRLVIRNVCRAIPGFLDRASFSTPARYSFCFGEDEEESPWTPLHVERGFPAESSTVTVHSVMNMTAASDSRSRDPEGVMDSIIKEARLRGAGGDRWLGEDLNIVVVVGPEHRRYFAEAGMSKADMRDYLWPRMTAPSGESGRRLKLGKPENILIVSAGGPGMAESWLLLPHLALAITKQIDTPGR